MKSFSDHLADVVREQQGHCANEAAKRVLKDVAEIHDVRFEASYNRERDVTLVAGSKYKVTITNLEI